jgi:glycosyltransferase involved in cell wall biosynthesis
MPAELKPAACHLLMTTDAVGGVWNYALDLARGLWDRNVFVTLAVLGPSPSESQRREAGAIAGLEILETELPLDWLSESAAEIERAADSLSRIARETGANLVQFNGSPLAGAASFSVPLIAMHHSCLATWWAAVKRKPLRRDWRWRADLVRRHLSAVDRVVVPSAAFAEMVVATYGLRERPLVIHNGRSSGAALARADGQGEALLAAGRLWDEGKDVETLDRAAALLEVPVLAAGPVEGPNGAMVKCRNLRLLGELASAEMRARLAARPIFVSTSVYEPFGLAVLEAAQAGCALLLSDIPTFRELWHGAALFVPPRDDRGLAEAAQHLLHEPALRAELGEAARARAESLGLDRAARAMASLYAELIKDHRGRRSPRSTPGNARARVTQGEAA